MPGTSRPPRPGAAIKVAAALDKDWLYQTYSEDTSWQSQSLLRVTVEYDPNGNRGYTTWVAVMDGPEGVKVSETKDPMVWLVSANSAGEPAGKVTLGVFVGGDNAGGEGVAHVTLRVRELGDVDGDGLVDEEDKVVLTESLRGKGRGFDRRLDLTSDGMIDARDAWVMNTAVNGQPVPQGSVEQHTEFDHASLTADEGLVSSRRRTPSATLAQSSPSAMSVPTVRAGQVSDLSEKRVMALEGTIQHWHTVRRDGADYVINVDSDVTLDGSPLQVEYYRDGSFHSILISPSANAASYLTELVYSAQTACLLKQKGAGYHINPGHCDRAPLVRTDSSGHTYHLNVSENIADYPPLSFWLNDFDSRKNLYKSVLAEIILQPDRYKDIIATGRAHEQLTERMRQLVGLSKPVKAIVSAITETDVVEQSTVVISLTEDELAVFAEEFRLAWDVQRFPRAAKWLNKLDTTAGLWQALARVGINVIQFHMYQTLVQFPACEGRLDAFEAYLNAVGEENVDPALWAAFADFRDNDFHGIYENYGEDLLASLLHVIDLQTVADLGKVGAKLLEHRLSHGVSQVGAKAVGAAALVISPAMDLLQDLETVNISTLAATLYFDLTVYLEGIQDALDTSAILDYELFAPSGDVNDNVPTLHSIYTYSAYLFYRSFEKFVTADYLKLGIDFVTLNWASVAKWVAITAGSFCVGQPDPAGYLHGLAVEALSLGDVDNRMIHNPDRYYSWLDDLLVTLPDLVVDADDISVSPQRAVPGDVVHIEALVHNEGAMSTDALVAIDLEGVKSEHATTWISGTQEIAPGESAQFIVDWNTTGFPDDSYVLTVRAFTDPETAELSEANNMAEKAITIGGTDPVFVKPFPVGMITESLPGEMQYMTVNLNEYFFDDDPTALVVKAKNYSNLVVEINADHVATVRGRDYFTGTEFIVFYIVDPANPGLVLAEQTFHVAVVAGSYTDALRDGSVTPEEGTAGTVFTYRVVYTHPEGLFPKLRKVVVNKVPHTMRWSGTPIDQGSQFTFAILGDELFGEDEVFKNEFYFEFGDGTRTFRFPEIGSLPGPTLEVHHDVALQLCNLAPLGPRPGTEAVVQCQVVNIGTVPEESLAVNFYVNDVLTESETIEYLWLKQESQMCRFRWIVPVLNTTESYTLKVEVVPVDGESNTNDNVYQWSPLVVKPDPGAVEGWVLDEWNNPVEAATVRVIDPNPTGSYGSAQTTSDGYFLLDGLKPSAGQYYKLEAAKDGSGKAVLSNVQVHTQVATPVSPNFVLAQDQTALVTSGKYLEETFWFPNGDKLIFGNYVQLGPNDWYKALTRVQEDGTGIQELAGPSKTVREFGRGAEVSRDGTKIVLGGKGSDGRYSIWIMNANGDGSDAYRVRSASSTITYFYPTFSPDGQRIAYAKRSESGGSYVHQVCIYNLSTAQETVLCTGEYSDLAWSPDGQWIAANAKILNATTGAVVLSKSDLLYPAWLPDCSGMLFYGPGGNIWLYRTGSSEDIRLTYWPEQESYPAMPRNDGSKMAFVSNKGFSGIGDFGIYRMPFTVPALYFASVSAQPDPFTPNGDGFNDTLSISYGISKAAQVTIKVHDSQGHWVRTLLDNEPQTAGPHAVTWDGKNQEGNQETDEVYFYRLDMHDATQISRPAYGRVTMVKDVHNIGPNVSWPRWSPDGTKIVYLDETTHSIYVCDALDGANKHVIATPYAVGRRPAWSADGQYLIFPTWSDPAHPNQLEIARINLDGTGYAELTGWSWGSLISGEFPSAGTTGTIVFGGVWNDPDNNYSYVTTMNQDGSGLSKVGDYKGDDPPASEAPTWSPDGRIVFAADNNNGGNLELYLMNSDGSAKQKLTNNPWMDVYPEFTSDPNRLLFASNRQVGSLGQVELWALALDGSEAPRCLVEFLNYGMPSPDGGRIVGQDTVIDLFLSLTKGAVEGQVIDSQTLEPIQNATVSLYQGGLVATTLTNELGGYQFYNIEPGEYTVTADAADYVTSEPLTVGVYAWVVSREHDMMLSLLPSVTVSEAPTGETIGCVVALHSEREQGDVELVRYEYRPQGGEWREIDTTVYPLPCEFDTEGLDSGDYEIRATAIDSLGNEDPTPHVVTVSVDHTAPHASIISPRNGDTVSGVVPLEASCGDLDLAFVVFQYRRANNVLWIDVGDIVDRAPWTTEWYAEHLTAGQYELRAIAVDGLGNMDNAPQAVAVAVAPTISIAAQTNRGWVYQNTSSTTLWRHESVLTIGVTNDPNGNPHYSATVTRNAASMGQVVIESTADPLVWHIKGGQHGVDPTGAVTLDITVTGVEHGGQGTTTINLTVRPLGDIDGDGDMDGDDKAQMNRRLNSLSVAYPDQSFNLTGDLDPFGNPNIDGDDKAVMNRLLNSLAVP